MIDSLYKYNITKFTYNFIKIPTNCLNFYMRLTYSLHKTSTVTNKYKNQYIHKLNQKNR